MSPLPLNLCFGKLLQEFDDCPVVFIREKRDPGLKQFTGCAGSEERHAVFARRRHRNSQVLIHGADVAARVLEPAIHDQFTTHFPTRGQGSGARTGRQDRRCRGGWGLSAL